MKILLIYSTNSGSTKICADIIKTTLEMAGQSVEMVQASNSHKLNFTNFDLIIVGSPSWDYEGKEGMPHEDMVDLTKSWADVDFTDKNFAVFGCGDKSYTFFAGAVDKLCEFIKGKNGKLVAEPLKIDSFYFDMEKNTKLVSGWTENLTKSS